MSVSTMTDAEYNMFQQTERDRLHKSHSEDIARRNLILARHAAGLGDPEPDAEEIAAYAASNGIDEESAAATLRSLTSAEVEEVLRLWT